MPYKDIEQQKQYLRDYNRRKRDEAHKTKETQTGITYAVKVECAEDLRQVLEIAINEVLQANADPLMRGRVIALLINAGAKILELTDISERIDRLEAIVLDNNKNKNKVIIV